MDDVEAIGLLAEPARAELYRFVAASPEPVGRDAAAEACGVSRSVAAFHLDKLAAAGLLEVTHRRLSGRSGPGAGRPAKLYLRSRAERAVALPPRHYDLAAAILADAADRAAVDVGVAAAARRAGRRVVDQHSGATVDELLRAVGYEPYRDDQGETRMRNCPFHRLAADHPPLVCSMSLALCESLVQAARPGTEPAMRLDPRPTECCVVISNSKPC